MMKAKSENRVLMPLPLLEDVYRVGKYEYLIVCNRTNSFIAIVFQCLILSVCVCVCIHLSHFQINTV